MKAVLLYKPHSDHARAVIEFARDFTTQTGKTLPLLDAESREGIDTAQLYELMRFPAIIVTGSDGSVRQSWQGELPRIGELSYFVSDGPV